MSYWEFVMTMEGWKNANCHGDGADEVKPPTEAEFNAMLEQYGTT